MATIVTVLRSGGDYKPKHVMAIAEMCARLMPEHRFVCMADCDVSCETIRLQTDWPRWWPKIEMFREFKDQPTIYIDLDTILFKPIRFDIKPGEFWMLRDFGKPEPASGIMAWYGDFSRIYDAMPPRPNPEDWDQRHIAKFVNPRYIQDEMPVYSYKKHCKSMVPENAVAVCFHGKPRPWQAGGWVSDVYRITDQD